MDGGVVVDKRNFLNGDKNNIYGLILVFFL